MAQDLRLAHFRKALQVGSQQFWIQGQRPRFGQVQPATARTALLEHGLLRAPVYSSTHADNLNVRDLTTLASSRHALPGS